MSLRRTRSLRAVAVIAAAGTALAGALVGAAQADPPRYSVKTPTSIGYGGAVTSVDPEASKIGIEVLKRAVDRGYLALRRVVEHEVPAAPDA